MEQLLSQIYSQSPTYVSLETLLHLLRYVMWNLFTVGSLQFPNDSTIASLEANY